MSRTSYYYTELTKLEAEIADWEAPILFVHATGQTADQLMNLSSVLLTCDPQAIALLGSDAEQLREFIEEDIFFDESSGDADFVPDPHISVHNTIEEAKHYVQTVLFDKYPDSVLVLFDTNAQYEGEWRTNC